METREINIRQILAEGAPFRIKTLEGCASQGTLFRTDGGVVAICTDGSAEIVVNTLRYVLEKGTEIILLDDMPLFIKGCSADFSVTLFLYSKEMAFQATRKFDSTFFAHVAQSPLYKHSEGGEGMMLSYMKILREMQNDMRNRYNTLIATNLLRSIMLNVYDKVQRYGKSRNQSAGSRKEEIFYRFMDLVIAHARKHRDVAYYADSLCISSKYLAEVTKEIAHETPKQTIDYFIVSEIKLMLTFSDMSIQQIADYLHFPDQSYLGRFFKHHTAMSPTAYRQQGMMY